MKPPIKYCAVYTRKSTEEGLEQDFNSLDAQREACLSYIASQKAEGWVPVMEAYDDGGYGDALHDLVYGDASSAWDPSFSNVKTEYVQYEFLSEPLVPGNHALQTYTDTEMLSLGTNVDLVEGSDGIAAHSMATLVIRKFADTEIGGATAWQAAAQYFWPVLYKDDFANQVGINDTVFTGRDATNHDWSSILRQIIAYSAIDDGTRVFGDTGIRALYDDANDLGGALAYAGANPAIQTFATSISKVFVQFAGELALHKVLQSNVTGAVEGILTYANEIDNHTLTVNLSGDAWTSTEHDLEVAQNNLVTSVASFYGLNVTPSVIDRIIFAVTLDDTTALAQNPATTPGTTLFVGSDGDDTVRGAKGNDVLIGGAGFDTADYSTDAANGGTGAITVDLSMLDSTGGSSTVTDGFGNSDTISGIERFVLGGGADIIRLDTPTGSVRAFEGGGGMDTVTYYTTGPTLDANYTINAPQP